MNSNLPESEQKSLRCPVRRLPRHVGERGALDGRLASLCFTRGDRFQRLYVARSLGGNLVKQLARQRIARRDAIALAYLCQLLLNSLPPMWKEIEEDYDATASQLLLNNITRSQAACHADQQCNEAAEEEAIGSRQP